ncbi:helix-turn-helix domain-containing protein [Sphingomonas mollis]|uniref:LysR family transcriptional regulator n=1 Tax=Sphingomonas mollis TaxID=2795726 RepID=A0ABS0XS38_9SPHN|nr:LysR family transcriptional regulator [Sphingomonas sp. BT553]MBJ6122859.1 LysR family transcriptional regulator [Sphingomonas sp. BT553]
MTDHHDPASPRGTALVTATDAKDGALDAHGFDPAAYDWVPVRRQRRPDGWTREKQRAFIEALADTGSVTQAAREVHMSPRSAYMLRRDRDGAGFAAAWNAALDQSMQVLLDSVTRRAIEGVDEKVYDRTGNVIGTRTRYSDRLAMFLLRAHMPDRFRPVSPEPYAPSRRTVAIEDALALLDPVPPAEPHRLMAPDDLDTALLCADLDPGNLPHWHRDPDMDPERPPATMPDVDPEFERKLEAAKREAATRDPFRRKRRKKPV